MEVQGKVAIVTGGSRGIGRAISRELAKEGVDVAIVARSPEALDQAAQELSAETGRRVISVPADTTKWEDVQRMVEATVAAFGKVDILVNNAARPGGQVRGTLAEATEQDLVEDLDTKVVGYFRCMKAVAPHMQRQALGPNHQYLWRLRPAVTIYGLRNAAVLHMTKTFSDQLGPDGITITSSIQGPR